MASIKFADSVFINCPFDPDYWPLFEVIVFTVIACGFVPRSALEEADGGDQRLSKIARLIGSSRFGIHDLSRIELDGNALPRFNMPFELGIDWALRHFGTVQQRGKTTASAGESTAHHEEVLVGYRRSRPGAPWQLA